MNPASNEGIGCRPLFLAATALVIGALVVGAVGLWLVANRDTGLFLFYAAAPASAVFGTLGGGIPVAWPLDLMLWLAVGAGVASWSGRQGWRLGRALVVTTAVALAYGAIMSRFVEIDRLGG